MNFSFNDWKLAEQKGIWPIEPSILFSHMMHSKHKAAAAASSRPLFFKPSKIMVGCAIHTTKERRRRRWSAGGTLGKTWCYRVSNLETLDFKSHDSEAKMCFDIFGSEISATKRERKCLSVLPSVSGLEILALLSLDWGITAIFPHDSFYYWCTYSYCSNVQELQSTHET